MARYFLAAYKGSEDRIQDFKISSGSSSEVDRNSVIGARPSIRVAGSMRDSVFSFIFLLSFLASFFRLEVKVYILCAAGW